MVGAPSLFQAHAVTAWLLFAIWPFTRLVHVSSVPLAYVGRSPVLYRSRRATPAPGHEEGREFNDLRGCVARAALREYGRRHRFASKGGRDGPYA